MTSHAKGMSLVEMLVVLGVMGVITAGTAAVIGNMMRTSNTIEAKQDLNALIFDVQNRIASHQGCQEALGIKPGVKKSFPQFNGNLASRKSTTNKTQPGLEVAFTLTNGETIAKNPKGKKATKLKGYALNADHIYLYDAENAYMLNGKRVRRVNLVGEFTAKKTVTGPGSYRRALATMFVVTNNNLIEDCFSINASDDSSMSAFCKLLGGTYDAKKGECTSTADVASICKALGGTYNAKQKECNNTTDMNAVCKALGGTYNAKKETCVNTDLATLKDVCGSLGGRFNTKKDTCTLTGTTGGDTLADCKCSDAGGGSKANAVVLLMGLIPGCKKGSDKVPSGTSFQSCFLEGNRMKGDKTKTCINGKWSVTGGTCTFDGGGK